VNAIAGADRAAATSKATWPVQRQLKIFNCKFSIFNFRRPRPMSHESAFELRPHVGRERQGDRVIEVVLPQDQIFYAAGHERAGQRVGYVGHAAGAPVCLIEHADAAFKADVAAFMTAVRGTPPRRVSAPPPQDQVEAAIGPLDDWED
jgi:hypothetical protein